MKPLILNAVFPPLLPMSDPLWLSQVKKHRAIAVIRAPKKLWGEQMALAVADGGMRLIEITWNSEAAAELIEQMRSLLPHCLIGAGTLLNVQQLQVAIASGAQFLFTPHLDLDMIRTATERNVPIIPGALTPTEILTAWSQGASCVKVFPVQAVGGATYIRNLQFEPVKQIPLIPTGGVTLENAESFLQAGAVAVALSTDLFPQDLVTAENWPAIAQRAESLMVKLQN